MFCTSRSSFWPANEVRSTETSTQPSLAVLSPTIESCSTLPLPRTISRQSPSAWCEALTSSRVTRLLVSASHHAEGDWRLIVRGNGNVLHDSIVGDKTAKDGWVDVSVDLTSFAGQKLDLEVQNMATGWSNEFGY